jgi:hypothetical protein
LGFQNGGKFIAANRVASIAFAVTANLSRCGLSLEPKFKGFTHHLRTILMGRFTGNLDSAQESLIETK